MFYMGEPSRWVRTIKFIQVYIRKLVPDVIIPRVWVVVVRTLRGLLMVKRVPSKILLSSVDHYVVYLEGLCLTFHEFPTDLGRHLFFPTFDLGGILPLGVTTYFSYIIHHYPMLFPEDSCIVI